jgi:hypothetical protein
VDASVWFAAPEEASRRANIDRPVDMSMLSELRRRPFSVTRDNMVLNDEGVAIQELEHYRRAGGQSPSTRPPSASGETRSRCSASRARQVCTS